MTHKTTPRPLAGGAGGPSFDLAGERVSPEHSSTSRKIKAPRATLRARIARVPLHEPALDFNVGDLIAGLRCGGCVALTVGGNLLAVVIRAGDPLEMAEALDRWINGDAARSIDVGGGS